MKRFGLYLAALAVLLAAACSSCSHVELTKTEKQWLQRATAYKPKRPDFKRMVNQTVKLTFIASKVHEDAPIEVEPYSATGVIVDGDSILTVAHLIEAAQDYAADGYEVSEYLIEFAGNYKANMAELEAIRSDLDLALVKVHGVLPIAGPTIAKEEAKLGDFVYTVGLNMTVEGFDLKMGIVARETIEKDVLDGVELQGRYLLNIAAMPGNSGSPVFNMNGELVGLLQSSIANYEDSEGYVWPMHIAGAARVESIRELVIPKPVLPLIKKTKPPKEVKTSCKSRMDLSLDGLKSQRCSKTN